MEKHPTEKKHKHALENLTKIRQNYIKHHLERPQKSTKKDPPNPPKIQNILPKKIQNSKNLVKQQDFFHTITQENNEK